MEIPQEALKRADRCFFELPEVSPSHRNFQLICWCSFPWPCSSKETPSNFSSKFCKMPSPATRRTIKKKKKSPQKCVLCLLKAMEVLPGGSAQHRATETTVWWHDMDKDFENGNDWELTGTFFLVTFFFSFCLQCFLKSYKINLKIHTHTRIYIKTYRSSLSWL